MLEMLLQKGRGGFKPGNEGIVMAMDFDTGWTDLANPTRSILVPGGGNVLLSTAQQINGSQSYQQNQPWAGTSQCVRTARTADLTFGGDFWMEAWVYLLGQGHTTFTGGYNWVCSFGKFSLNGVQGLALENLKPVFVVPNGGGLTVLAQSSATAVNNAWQHLAVGRKNGRIYLFLNGQLVATADYTDAVGYEEFLSIGGYYDNRNAGDPYSGLNGYMDRLRIFNRCLATENFTPLTTAF